MKAIIEHIAFVTQFYNAPISKEALTAQIVRDQNLNVNYHSLSEVLKAHGFENHISKRSLKEIPSLSVPVVIILKNEEAAVITKIERVDGKRKYHLYQAGINQVVADNELEALYLDYCWFIKPIIAKDERSELPEYHLPKSWYWKVIWRFRPYYYQVILATFIINFLALVSSLYVMNVYDRVIPNKTYETLWALSIGVVLAILFELIAKLIRSHLTDIAGKKADLIISSALFRRVMSIRLVDKPVSAGSYANNLREFESVRDFMTSASLLVLVDLPFILLFIFVIYLVGGYLALVPLFIIPIVAIVGLMVQPRIAKHINETMRESSQRQGLVVEAVDGIETLKTNNATNWAQQRWDTFTARTAATQIKVRNLSSFITNFTTAMQQLNTVFLVLLGTYLIHAENEVNRITMGALIASVILSGRALAPLGQIANLATRFQQARLALQGIDNIIERPIERKADREYITLSNVQGQINLKNIHFQYQEDSAEALSNISLNIQAGEKVAILGRVGSGKSTLLKLIAGLYDTNKGGITLDNVNIQQIDPNFLRSQVTLFEQSPHLFLGTLRENMDLSRSDSFANDQALLVALNRFGLMQLVQSHPRGLGMPLGENGLGLSGGQKQLVALARLTLRDPRVVLLDEPTSDLDQGSEIKALQSLAHWAKNRTMIVVTHRPQVLQIVNRIIVMDNGKVIMDGPRDAVLARLKQNEQEQANKNKSIQKKSELSANVESVGDKND
ncbi:type I secretion system permease/ATPase [[Pasteurella] aerogenes]|nr:type I secretion system permease/ATPase [[Pasteurella] aerogenes]